MAAAGCRALICAGLPRWARFCKRKVDELIAKNTGTREAGQQRPGGFRVILSRASARESHQKNLSCPATQNPLLDPPQHGAVAQRVPTADFFGASSVASALDVARRRDPADNDLTLSRSLPPPSQNRNFLLCLAIAQGRVRAVLQGLLSALLVWHKCPRRNVRQIKHSFCDLRHKPALNPPVTIKRGKRVDLCFSNS